MLSRCVEGTKYPISVSNPTINHNCHNDGDTIISSRYISSSCISRSTNQYSNIKNRFECFRLRWFLVVRNMNL